MLGYQCCSVQSIRIMAHGVCLLRISIFFLETLKISCTRRRAGLFIFWIFLIWRYLFWILRWLFRIYNFRFLERTESKNSDNLTKLRNKKTMQYTNIIFRKCHASDTWWVREKPGTAPPAAHTRAPGFPTTLHASHTILVTVATVARI